MDLSQATAHFGLSARATATRHGSNWSPRVGIAASSVAFPDADICYSFRITSGALEDTAQLDLTTGLITQEIGSPAVEGGGTDFEGVQLPAMAFLYGIIVTVPGSNTSNIAVALTMDAFAYLPQNVFTAFDLASCHPFIYPAPGIAVDATDILTMTFEQGAQIVDVTVIGKSAP
jgi:hypothetical protein